jgi:dTDP-4-dehydrorhamnose reductase
MRKQTILIIGSQGQLGCALVEKDLNSNRGDQYIIIPYSRKDLDITDQDAVRDTVRSIKPDWVINAAAYTAVDLAESHQEQAYLVNTAAPGFLAMYLAEYGGKMLHISTDFVFAGDQAMAQQPQASTQPLSIYGQTKLAGENAVLAHLGNHGHAHILRTSWLYSTSGKNFLLTMLRLHQQCVEKSLPLRVVCDQLGCPTSAPSLAKACWAVLERSLLNPLSDVLHWSDAGVASWYDFAVAIGDLACENKLINAPAVVEPIATSQYPTPARRPAMSLLDCQSTREELALNPRHWRHELQAIIVKNRLLLKSYS